MLRSQSSSATLIAGWRLVQLQPTQLLQPPHSAHFCAMKHTGASIAGKTAIKLQSGFCSSPEVWRLTPRSGGGGGGGGGGARRRRRRRRAGRNRVAAAGRARLAGAGAGGGLAAVCRRRAPGARRSRGRRSPCSSSAPRAAPRPAQPRPARARGSAAAPRSPAASRLRRSSCASDLMAPGSAVHGGRCRSARAAARPAAGLSRDSRFGDRCARCAQTDRRPERAAAAASTLQPGGRRLPARCRWLPERSSARRCQQSAARCRWPGRCSSSPTTRHQRT